MTMKMTINDNDNKGYSWSQIETKEPGGQHDIIQYFTLFIIIHYSFHKKDTDNMTLAQ